MIDAGQYQWPVPYKGHPGTPRLHEDGFSNGHGLFKVLTYRDPAEVVDEEYPVWLTTGRRLQTYGPRTQTVARKGLTTLSRKKPWKSTRTMWRRGGWGLAGGWARMGPGVPARLPSKSRPPARSRRGTVFASFAFNETPVNILTGSGYDPVSQTAELKVCPVRIDPLSAAADS